MKSPAIAGLFLATYSDIEVVFGQLLVQATLFEKVVDDTALGQVGLGDFHHRLGIVCIVRDKVFVQLKIFFVSAHLFHSRPATGAICAPYSGKN
jgi:hypothetical protein